LSWEIIDRHRENARKITFDILIWGPAKEDCELYSIRNEIKDFCSKAGHSAKFSEELIHEGTCKPAPNPLTDEVFHADAASIIIVLYESRGTQTEYDRILKYNKFINKSLIFIEVSTWDKIRNSLSGFEWSKKRHNVVILDKFNSYEIIRSLNNYLEELQFSEYLRNLEINLLSQK
jgi:hypothetical protein